MAEDQQLPDAGTLHDEVISLRIVGGPDSGKEFPLTSSEVTIGRSSNCDIAIGDNMLSRQHVRLVRSGLDWDIVDLGSTNGTWLKGERLKGRLKLIPRLPVRIGQTLFEITGGPGCSELLDEKLISYREAAISAGNLESVIDDRDRNARLLAAIYRFQGLITEDQAKTDLYQKILELISETIHADTAYFLAWSDDEQRMVPIAERSHGVRVEKISTANLSYSIIDYVREKKEAIISVDAQSDDRFGGESLINAEVHSVMCVPILGRQQFEGMIYVISTDPKNKYRQDELKLLNIIGHSAAMTLENRQLVEGNIKAQRMAAIGMTAASLSHYVKNILNGLEGSVSLLRMGIDETDKMVMDQAWDVLSNNTTRLSTLMMDLLSLAKEHKPEFSQYNISEVIMDTMELLKPKCAEDNIQFTVDEQVFRRPIRAEVDGKGIHRVLLNLINNAIDAVREKHLECDTGTISLQTELNPSRDEIEIIIADNGRGIPLEEQEKIFDEFHTAKGDRGTGLGLAVSRRIIDAHHGRIEVESSEESGTTFHVILPLSQDSNRTQALKVSSVRDSQKMHVSEDDKKTD